MSVRVLLDDDDERGEPLRAAPVAAPAPADDVIPELPRPVGYRRLTNAAPAPVPSYTSRALRLKTLRMGGFTRFLLFEGVIGVTALLALLGVASVWTVPAAVVAVLVMVKLNDAIATALRRDPPGAAEE